MKNEKQTITHSRNSCKFQ